MMYPEYAAVTDQAHLQAGTIAQRFCQGNEAFRGKVDVANPEQDIPDTPEIHAAEERLMATPYLHGRPTKASIINGTWKGDNAQDQQEPDPLPGGLPPDGPLQPVRQASHP
jgi:hypothetical protein